MSASAALFLACTCWVVIERPLSPPGAWQEIYARHPVWWSALWIVAPLTAILVLVAGWSHLPSAVRGKPAARIGIPLLLMILCAWTLKSAQHLRMAGPGSNYFYYTAVIGPGAFLGQAMNIGQEPGPEDASAYLRDFPQIGSQHWGALGGTRVISNPPGATLLMYGCRKILEAVPALQEWYAEESPPPADASQNQKRAYLLNALCQFAPDVMVLLIALGMPPLWWLARVLIPERRQALAAGLCLFLPAMLVFQYAKDAYQVSIALWFWWLIYLTFGRRSGLCAAASGAALYLGFFFSLSFAVIAVIPAAILVVHCFQSNERGKLKSHMRGVLGLLTAALGSFGLCGIVLYWMTGYDTVSSLLAAFGGHRSYHQFFSQRYSLWIWLNLVHLLFFMGGPAAAAWILALIAEARNLWRARSLRTADACLLCVSGVLLLLNFSGKNLAEVPRLWLFFMPALIVVSEKVHEKGEAMPNWAMTALLLMQGIQASVFVICFDPLGASRRAMSGLLQGL